VEYIAFDIIRIDVESQCNDNVPEARFRADPILLKKGRDLHSEQHGTLQVVGFPILDEIVDDKDCTSS
jgi:hypothetical protein